MMLMLVIVMNFCIPDLNLAFGNPTISFYYKIYLPSQSDSFKQSYSRTTKYYYKTYLPSQSISFKQSYSRTPKYFYKTYLPSQTSSFKQSYARTPKYYYKMYLPSQTRSFKQNSSRTPKYYYKKYTSSSPSYNTKISSPFLQLLNNNKGAKLTQNNSRTESKLITLRPESPVDDSSNKKLPSVKLQPYFSKHEILSRKLLAVPEMITDKFFRNEKNTRNTSEDQSSIPHHDVPRKRGDINSSILRFTEVEDQEQGSDTINGKCNLSPINEKLKFSAKPVETKFQEESIYGNTHLSSIQPIYKSTIKPLNQEGEITARYKFHIVEQIKPEIEHAEKSGYSIPVSNTEVDLSVGNTRVQENSFLNLEYEVFVNDKMFKAEMLGKDGKAKVPTSIGETHSEPALPLPDPVTERIFVPFDSELNPTNKMKNNKESHTEFDLPLQPYFKKEKRPRMVLVPEMIKSKEAANENKVKENNGDGKSQSEPKLIVDIGSKFTAYDSLKKNGKLPRKLLVPEIINRKEVAYANEVKENNVKSHSEPELPVQIGESVNVSFKSKSSLNDTSNDKLLIAKLQLYFSKHEKLPRKLLVPEMNSSDKTVLKDVNWTNAADDTIVSVQDVSIVNGESSFNSVSLEANEDDTPYPAGVLVYLVSDPENLGAEFLVSRAGLLRSNLVLNKIVKFSAWTVKAAGSVEITNQTSFHLTELQYQPSVVGPASWMVGNIFPIKKYPSTVVLAPWSGDQVVDLSLPDQMPMSDVSWLALYCSICSENKKIILHVYIPETFL